MLKNGAKFSFVECLSGTFMFFAKVFVACLTTTIGYFIIPPMVAPVQPDRMVPCMFIFVLAYLVTSVFVSVFDAASLTILQCYLFDVDISKHHGVDGRHVP
jgi:hypothetical protein